MNNIELPYYVPESRHEVYHQDDRGDWELAYFDVPLGSRLQPTEFAERVQREFKSTVTKWAKMIDGEGGVPTTKPHLYPAACFVPEPGKEDYRRFYISARVKRTKPLLVSVETAEQYADMGRVSSNEAVANFLREMRGLTDNNSAEKIGEQARENAGLAAKAAEQERMDAELEYRLTHLI